MTALVLSWLDCGNATLFGLPAVQLDRYQAVLNASAKFVFGACSRDHITPLLEQLHWLRARERISFKIACITWRCLNGTGPKYLSVSLKRSSDHCGHSGLRSENSLDLIPPLTRNATHGDRAWPMASASIWNSLDPHHLKNVTNYLSFRKGVKSFLWHQSYS